MQRLFQASRRLWRAQVLYTCAAVLFGAFVGVAAGRNIIRHFSGCVSVVDGNSMAPSYPAGACVYTAPVSGDLERGAVVMIDDGNKEPALKRIVGLPGETIHLWRGYVFVNLRMLREPYLPRFTFTFPDEKNERFEFQLGENEFFVLGDNRVCSVDSRAYGPLDGGRIRGQVPAQPGLARATFLDYTLPAPGKRTIRRIAMAAR